MVNVTYEEEVINVVDNNTVFSNDLDSLRGLSIYSLNVNSFNLSTYNASNIHNHYFIPKLNHILQQRCHIYLLQDVRLSDKLEIFCNEVRVNLYGNYEIFTNSKNGSRGTVILLSDRLNYKVFRTFKSTCENILGLDLAINNFRLTLMSVYGPKQYQNENFFPDLKRKILDINNESFLLGGDLNSVPNTIQHNISPLINNIDILQMENLPNIIHCRELASWISDDFACDLFRLNNPNKIDHSHNPIAKNGNSFSRIDHFMSSPNLAEVFTHCEYLNTIRPMFDHKSIFLIFSAQFFIASSDKK